MIPAELRALKGWLVWRLEPNPRPGKKPLKVPYYVDGGKRRGVQGSAEDRDGWATWEAAQRFVDDDLVGEWGLGFALCPDWGVVGLDFDACVLSDGTIDPEVERVIEGTYAEFSPSGTGVHAFLAGKLPNRKSRAEGGRWGFEVFCTTGFLTMTGLATPACELVGWDSLEHVNGAVTELCEARFGSGGIRVREPGTAVVARGKGYTEDTLRALLWRVTPDGSYSDWVKRGMALHHETGGAPWGCTLWDEHSATGKDYAGSELIESKWEGFGRDGAGGGTLVTVAYLERLALTPSADVFDVVVEAEPDADAPPPLPQFSRNRAGAILPTMDNAVMAIERPDVCGMRIGHDEFRDEITVSRPGVDEWVPMTDADVVRLMIALERLGFKTAAKEMVRSAVVLVAARGRYDSAQLWLGGLKWDGKERVRSFLATYLGVEGGAGSYAEAVSLYIWTALAGRVLQPGVKADMVPIFEGAQGLRKSSAIEAMSPAPEFFVEIDLGEKEDDTVRKLRGALVAEIAELSGLHTRDLEGIKKFVVRKTEKWVPKYKEFPSTFKRRLIFVGTTNRVEILADDTGNRRWLPLHIERADAEGIARDCLQLWAEGAELFRGAGREGGRGGVAWEDAERLAPAAHADYAMADAWDGRVAAWLEGVDDDLGGGAGAAVDGSGVAGRARGDSPFATADVLAGAVGLAAKDMNRAAANRVGAILRPLGYEQRATKRNGVVFRAWRKVTDRP